MYGYRTVVNSHCHAGWFAAHAGGVYGFVNAYGLGPDRYGPDVPFVCPLASHDW